MSLFRRRRRETRVTPSPASEVLVESSTGATRTITGPFATPKYPYSETSLARLATCDKRLQDLFMVVANKFDVSIIEGHRSEERQLELYNSGASKVKRGKHNYNPSRAVDAAVYPINWQDTEQFVEFGYFVQGAALGMGIGLRFGGDFDQDMEWRDSTFLDLVHFELTD